MADVSQLSGGGLIYLPPNPHLEAVGNGITRRIQRASRAYAEVVKDRNATERDELKQILARLGTLKASLTARLLGESATDFRRFTVQTLLRDVDREIERTTADLERSAKAAYDRMATLGEQAADRPIEAAQVTIQRGLPGVDRDLVATAFDNTVELLTQPMQQFAADVKVALRQVALAGDNKMDAILRLRDRIAGAGFDNAEYRAERIIRTELGRVFEQSNYDRLVSLSNTFPFLRKYWRASKDNRTRLGHVEAARTYPRGGGIGIAQAFQVNVHAERPGQPAKLLGTASLRFPLDPTATPAGKLAAAATIMCRCGAVVDFDVADFAAYSANQIQLALGGVKPPIAGPVPVPAPTQSASPAALGQQLAGSTSFYQGRFYFGSEVDARSALSRLGVSGTVVKTRRGFSVRNAGGEFFGPGGWLATTERPALQRRPRQAAAVPLQDIGPAGVPVSQALQFNVETNRFLKRGPMQAALIAKVKKALAVLDRVHGDGELPEIPVVKLSRRHSARGVQAYYSRSARDNRPLELSFGSKALTAEPYNTIFHELGHFLDHAGFDADRSNMSSEVSGLFENWRQRVKQSEAIQSLHRWRQSTPGDGVAPLGVSAKQIDYMLTNREVWARAYSQWVMVKSGDAVILKELQKMQAQATVGPVDRSAAYLGKATKFSTTSNSWGYPWVWSDADFKPIEEAIDNIMESKGWRKRK